MTHPLLQPDGLDRSESYEEKNMVQPGTTHDQPEGQGAAENCRGCFKTADMEPVEVKREGKWVASTVRRCTNPECHAVREGTLDDRIAHVLSVYGYKYFGDYELSPEQMDAVGEAVEIMGLVPDLYTALKELREACAERDRNPGLTAADRYTEALFSARAALSKATGRAALSEGRGS